MRIFTIVLFTAISLLAQTMGGRPVSNAMGVRDYYPPINDPVVITTEPTNDTVTTGDTARFVLSVTGTAPITYKWYKVPADSVWADDTLLIPDVPLSMDGNQYYCIVSNAFGADTSDTVALKVNRKKFTIDTSIVGSGTLSMNPEGLLQDSGTVISFTGTASSGWVGDTTFGITLEKDTSVTVTFTEIPVIDSIRPSPWYRLRAVDIYGTGFGTQDSVMFGGIKASTISLWTNTHITVVQPDTFGVFSVQVKSATAQQRVLKPRSR